jgi:hypothetical protein
MFFPLLFCPRRAESRHAFSRFLATRFEMPASRSQSKAWKSGAVGHKRATISAIRRDTPKVSFFVVAAPLERRSWH